MTITYEWTLQDGNSLECAANIDGNENVVRAVNWRLTGTDGTHGGATQGQQPIPYDPASFTPYTELTLETIMGWVRTAMGSAQVAVVEGAVADQIAVQADPPVVTPPLPWATPPE